MKGLPWLFCQYPQRPLRCLAALRYQWFRSYVSSIHEREEVQSDHSGELRALPKLGKLKDSAKGKNSDEESPDPPKQQTGPWRPLKRLTRYEMDHMRSLREMQPEEWTYDKLGKTFGVSFSAVRRILRSKFDPSPEVRDRQEKQVQQLRLKRRKRLIDNIHSAKQEHSN